MDIDQLHILIIDDHQLIIDGLESVLHTFSASSRVSHTNDAGKALEWLIAGQEFDLVLVDINMPGMDGFSFLKAINENNVLVPVVVISATENVHDVGKVLHAGALGFISKASKSDELFNAIKSILSGNIYTPPWYNEIDEENFDDPKQIIARQLNISKRQLDVLELMAAGHPNKQIADILFVSEATVKSHVSALFEILQVKNRMECINAARRHGIIINEG